MASRLRLTVSAGRSLADDAWAEVMDEFAASDAAMSQFRDDSELTRLNASSGTGRAVSVGRRLEQAVLAADRARRITDGRFDPRVPVDLERLGYHGARLVPFGNGASATRGATASPMAGRVVDRLAAGSLMADRPLDLGGIGKGLALRWAAARVERLGIGDFLLDAGGDLVARGRAPEGFPWFIGIEDPGGVDEPLGVIAIDRGAVATTSIRRTAWSSGDLAVHHLLDPRTGEPAIGGLAAVTVAGPDPAWAEVWSKTLFIGGSLAIGMEARRRGMAAWWVGTDGTLGMTPAARARTRWIAGEA